MKAALAFVLTVLMVATPATQVLAQTPQGQDVPGRTDVDVPLAQPVTADVTAMPSLHLLPSTNPMEGLLPAQSLGLAEALHGGADELPPVPIAKPLKIGLIVVGSALAILIVLFVICLSTDDDCLNP